MSRLIKFFAGMIIVLGLTVPALADSSEEQQLVDKSVNALNELRSDINFRGPVDHFLSRAYGVIIFPNVLKAGFIIGAEGGRGILMVRGHDGTWSNPAFYVLGSGSFGLQAGAKVSQLVLVINTSGGLDKIMHNSVKIGADLSAAAGPYGAGAQAATTTNAGADIYVYGKGEGLYAGVNVEGSVISSDDEYNQAYYGRAVSPTDIVINRKVHSAGAEGLRHTLDGIHG